MIRIRTIPLALLVTGCFSVPPYAPDEAVTFTATGAGGVVAGNLASNVPFELHFPDGDGFRFPNALMVDGVNLLGHDPRQGCSAEDELGFRISPAPRISATGVAPRVTNTLTPALQGPAVVQVRLDWSTRLACNPARNPGGASTFTVFPDGRIVRFDQLSDPSSAAITASQCSCDGAGSLFTVSTFWTIARGSFRGLYHTGSPDAPQQVPGAAMEMAAANTDTQCLDDGTRQVAFAWGGDSRGTTVRGSEQLIGFGFEFLFDGSILESFTWDKSSALFLSRTDCPSTLVRAREHAMPSQLLINGVDAPFSPRDGIYGGDTGNAAGPGIELSGGERFELTGATKAAFAVWLRFPRAVDAVRAARAGAMGVWYVPQRVDDRSWILFFKEPLPAGQMITVEPI